MANPHQTSIVRSCDVLIVGGGPAGSTVGALLAQKGWQVALLEKEHHPRFHIGESLLPMNLPILERLGVLDAVREIGIVKYAAEFVSDRYGGRSQSFHFARALDRNHPYAFEVRRSEFDHLLLKNCAAKGTAVHEGVRANKVEFRAGDTSLVHATDESGQRRTWEARYVIDASGRDTLLSRQLGWKQKSAAHASAAIFGHFDNVVRRTGRDEGNITIAWFDYGWFWMIPLRDGSMSVGAVCWPEYLRTRTNSPEEFLWDTIRRSSAVYDRMRNATLTGEARATGNYSYRSRRVYTEGALLIGDAVAFIDPVFSSGVYLAMNSGCLAADAIDECLRHPQAAPRLMRAYERRVRSGLKLLSWFIYRFTSPALHRLFMYPRNIMRLEETIISMLAGDVFGKTPIRARLMLFKLIYYTVSGMRWRDAWRAYRARRGGIGQTFKGDTILRDQESPDA